MKKTITSLVTMLILLLGGKTISTAQTTLSPGDLVIVSINGDTDAPNYGRGFSFMPLVNLEAGTTINFTDYGWSDVTGAFITNGSVADAFIHYTASSAITAGTIIRCDSYQNTNFTFDYSYSGLGNNWLNTAGLTQGDELLVFQGLRSSPTFICAASIVNNTLVASGWATSVGTDGTDGSGAGSALPGSGNASVADLVDDVTALSFNQPSGSNDNCSYSGLTTGATKAQWQTRIQTYSNWTFNDAIPIPTPPVGPYTVISPSTAPTVTTQAVSDILATTATGNGTVTATGGANITERGIYWSTTDGFADGAGTKVSTTGDWSVTGAFTQAITGLTAGTTIYLKAFATNSAGTGYGAQVSFTTTTTGTILSAGDIAFVMLNNNVNPMTWAWVPLVDIESGTVIYFTDDGWDGVTLNSFSFTEAEILVNNEDLLTFTATSAISKGTVISVSGSTFTPSYGTVSVYGVVPPNSSSGDQVLAYQGTFASPTFIAGVHADYNSSNYNLTTKWNETNYNTTRSLANSTLPVGLANGSTCVSLYPGITEQDFAYYSGTTMTGTKTELLALINNYANWTTNNTTAYTWSRGNFTVNAGASTPIVTTQAVSDISATTATGNGTVTATGGANITERGIYWSTTDGFADGTGTKVSTTGDWSATGAFTQAITGLTAGTTIYLKAFATNSAGTGYGAQVSFTTTTPTSTITFDVAGGTPGIAPITQDEGTAVTPPANPTRSGYTFNGWVPAVPATMPVDDVTCVAQWTANQSTITFNSAGGSAISAITQDEGTAVTPPANPTRSGYTFAGWIPAVPATMPMDDVTCVAQWTANQSTITFNSAGGSAVSAITQDEGTAVTPPANPTRSGYTFNGWVPAVPATMPVDDVTCVAQWTANQSTITFNSSGGSAVSPITQDEGTAVSAPANPTRSGYTFAGWVPAVPATMPVDDVTCVAQWTANQSTITFNSAGGSAVSPITQDEGTAVTPPANPTRSGYTFNGWVPAVPANMPVDDVTCDAQWTANQSTITFNSAGGSAVSPITQDEGTAVTPPANPTRSGYTFNGWVPTVPATMPVDDVTCVAQWTANQSTITFNSAGGSAVSPITQDEGTAVTPPANPTRSGYIFDGWVPAVPSTMPVDDITCVAQWHAELSLTCPDNFNVNTDQNVCTASVSFAAEASGTPTPTITYKVNNNPITSPYNFPGGTTTVDVTATNGPETKNCSFTVTVTDNQPPTITCPATVTANADQGQCYATITNLGTPQTGDNCGLPNVSSNAPANNQYPVGNTTVIWTAVDANNNSTTCTQTITVTDNQAPVLGYYPETAQELANMLPGSPDGEYTLYIDNDPSKPFSAYCYNMAGTPVEYITLVNTGGTTNRSQYQALGFTSPPNSTVNTNWYKIRFNPLTRTVNTADYLFTTSSGYITHQNTSRVPYGTARDCTDWGSSNGIANVDLRGTSFAINDTWSLGGWQSAGTTNFSFNNQVASITGGGYCGWNHVTGTGDPTVGGFYLTLAYLQPTFANSVPNIIVPASQGSCFGAASWIPPVASDNCGLQSLVCSAVPGDEFPVGNTVVTYTATDTHGNTSTCSFTVTVTDNQPPSIVCPPNITVNADQSQCYATLANLGTPQTGDNCGVLNTTNNAPVSNHYTVGNTTVIWTVTDINNNSASCAQTITVIDDQLPTISCPATITVNADQNQCYATLANLGIPQTSDNCGVLNTTNNAPVSNHYAVGNTTVIWTVLDVNNNSASCAQIITVTDNQLPTISCPANITVNADQNQCYATLVNPGTPATDDNCGVQGVINNTPANNQYPIGTTTLTWSVTDINGNTATCTQTITVKDLQPPVLVCPANVESCPGADNNPVAIQNIAPLQAYDLCSDVIIRYQISGATTADGLNDASGTLFQVGTSQVMYTVEDANGNASSCSFSVIVHPLPIVTFTGDYSAVPLCTQPFQLTGGQPTGGTYTSQFVSANTFYPRLSGPGIHTVSYTFMDEHGCFNSTDFSVTIQPPLEQTVTVGVAGDFPTLTGAGGLFAYLNTNPVSANITARVLSDLSEPGTYALNPLTSAGDCWDYSLVIEPLTPGLKTITANLSQAMIRLNGADRVTINGTPTGGSNFLFRNENNNNAILLLENGACNNTIEGCTFEGSNTTTTSGLIVLGGSTSGSGNSGNTFSANQIRKPMSSTVYPANLFYSSGNNLYPNQYNTLVDNEMKNFSAVAINVTPTGNGGNWIISGNNFFFSSSPLSLSNLQFIRFLPGSLALNNQINANFIGGTLPSRGGAAWQNNGTGTMKGIEVNAGSCILRGNQIGNLILGSSGLMNFSGIILSGSGSSELWDNTVSAITVAGTGSFTGISSMANGISLLKGNDVFDLTYTAISGSPTIKGIEFCRGTADGNLVHSITTTKAGILPTIYGLSNLAISVPIPNLITNNMIAIGAGASTKPKIYGIFDNSITGEGGNFLHNTVYLNGPATQAYFTAAFYRIGNGNIKLYNNILVNNRVTNSIAKHYAIVTNSPYFWQSDYNALYCANSCFGKWGATNYNAFMNWKAMTGQDLHSLNLLPQFVSATDLHLSLTNTALDNFGTPLFSTSFDYDGSPRSLSTPDMGAHEFTAVAPTKGAPAEESEGISQSVGLITYPNPFISSTLLEVTLPKQATVELSVYTLLGDKIETLAAGELQEGVHTFRFDASDQPSGIYFCVLRINGEQRIVKRIERMK